MKGEENGLKEEGILQQEDKRLRQGEDSDKEGKERGGKCDDC
jgi:hypothetical protein